MKISLDHIAVLTASLESCAEQLPTGYDPLEIEFQPGEGTREQYVLHRVEGAPSLLFMEPVEPGPYQRAMEKRGPGLHHLGYVTDSLNEAVELFSVSGLLLHPISLRTHSSGVVWMCRPGVPFLVELCGSLEQAGGSGIPVEIGLPVNVTVHNLCHGSLPGVVVGSSGDDAIRLSVAGESLRLRP